MRRNLFLILLISLTLFAAITFEKKPSQKIITPINQEKLPQKVIATPVLQPISKELGLAVSSGLSGSFGTYGVFIKNLKTGESYYQNEHRFFDAASLYKLWVLGAIINRLQNGSLKETDKLSNLTLDEALTQMITVSDNSAAILLTDKIGLSSISSYLISNGFYESKVGGQNGSPIITPSDMSLFLEKIYTGQLANPIYTEKMINLLKQQKLNDGLPKYLPENIIIAHKTGELEPFNHDAGIIYTDNGDYIIVVLTETDSRPQSRERIALVSKEVYNYFNQIPQ